jgi:O-antigen/teichoic acid export membrane protein
MADMSETRILAWNTAVQAVGKILSTALGVVMIAVMTRKLGQEGFGIYTTAISYFQIFALLLDLGINVMYVQMLGENKGDRAAEDRITSATYTFRLVTSLGLLTLAPIIALFLEYPWELKLTLFAIWGAFLSTCLNQIVIGTHQRHLKMHVVAAAEVFGRVIMVGGVVVAAFLDWGIVPMALLISLGNFANFALNILVARRYASFAFNWNPKFWLHLLKRSWPIGISIIFNLIYYRADTLILSYVRPMAEVGLYGAAYRVLEILIAFPFMYTGVLLPLIAHAWIQKDHERYDRLLRTSYVAMMLMAAPLVAGTLVVGGPVMQIVAGADFAASGDILKILALAVGLIFLGTVSSHAIVALDAQRRTVPLYIAVALLTLMGYLILIPRFGMYAAAWLTVASESVVAIGTTVISLRRSRTRLPWGQLGKCLAAAGIMALTVWPLRELWLPIPVTLGAVVYLGFILIFNVVTEKSVKELVFFRQGAPPADVA